MHNGTINHLGDRKKDVSDSRELVTLLNVKDLDISELYHDTIDKGAGAAALIWHDREDNTLNFLRNPKRPLAFQMLSNKTGLFASSEKDHLEMVTKKSSMYFANSFELKPGLLISYDLEDHTSAALELSSSCGEFKDVKKSTTYPATRGTGVNGNYHGYEGGPGPRYNGGREVKTVAKSTASTKPVTSPLVPIHTMNYKGPRGNVFTKGRARTDPCSPACSISSSSSVIGWPLTRRSRSGKSA
jgi:hypothetical protein